VTEALLTVALIAVHVPSAGALVAVVAYRAINFLAPTLVAHSSLERGLEGRSGGSTAKA
jgi:hypothetical protein